MTAASKANLEQAEMIGFELKFEIPYIIAQDGKIKSFFLFAERDPEPEEPTKRLNRIIEQIKESINKLKNNDDETKNT